ncbi:hypothetical protein GGS24DRAFT_502343 [Hypoxylon argillaceum]|nr:hypothetical protein GGS24DRAFT_502343 [Hypoxylon argillaceum]
MEKIRSIRGRALSHINEKKPVEVRQGFNYSGDLYDIVDELIWPAVHYVDGPMRPHMQRNAVFAAFCENVESFEKLFKSDRNTRGYDGPSRRIPTFVRQYLHHQLERDLDWLDIQFCETENCHLQNAFLNDMIDTWGFKVGIVVRLAIHLLCLIPLQSSAERRRHSDDPGDNENKFNDDRTAYCLASEVVTDSIGYEPQFLWGVTKMCYFAVSHKYPGSMDRCWLNPTNEGGSTPFVRVNPSYHGTIKSRNRNNYTAREVPPGNYDSPEDLLCIFRTQSSISAVVDASRYKDPAAHQNCFRLERRRTRNPTPIVGGEISNLWEIQSPRTERRWTSLLKGYMPASRSSIISKFRSAWD